MPVKTRSMTVLGSQHKNTMTGIRTACKPMLACDKLAPSGCSTAAVCLRESDVNKKLLLTKQHCLAPQEHSTATKVAASEHSAAIRVAASGCSTAPWDSPLAYLSASRTPRTKETLSQQVGASLCSPAIQSCKAIYVSSYLNAAAPGNSSAGS